MFMFWVDISKIVNGMLLRCLKTLTTQNTRSYIVKTVLLKSLCIFKHSSLTVTSRNLNSAVKMNFFKPKDKTGKKTETEPQDQNKKITRSVTTAAEKSWRDHYLNLPLEEKRKVYSCGSKYLVLDEIDSWAVYAETITEKIRRASKPVNDVDDILNMKISLWRGDITTLEIDAIVNAANSSLLGGGGVDGSIHRAAGKKLVEECAKLNGCQTGDAKLTGGYKLPAKYVIHTVGPIGQQPAMLSKCYKSCLNIAKEMKIRTVAFPCISTGIYGYDVTKATPVVMETVRSWLEDEENAKCIDKIIFCVFLINDVAVYEGNLLKYFPVEKFDALDSLPEIKRPKTTSNDAKSETSDIDESKENVKLTEKSNDETCAKEKQNDMKTMKGSENKLTETENIQTKTDINTKQKETETDKIVSDTSTKL